MSLPEESSAPADNEQAGDRPVLTIHLHSWATPVVGLAMLVIGLLGGFFLRPFIRPAESEPAPAQAAVQPAPDNQAPNAASGTPVPTIDRAGLMQAVVDRTRHFLGDPEAPVTIIELSDFL
jgi:hypothetical protein